MDVTIFGFTFHLLWAVIGLSLYLLYKIVVVLEGVFGKLALIIEELRELNQRLEDVREHVREPLADKLPFGILEDIAEAASSAADQAKERRVAVREARWPGLS